MAFKVTPWSVEGEIDYDKLLKEFGTQKITDDILNEIESLVGELHFMLRRGFFYSHRDLDKVLKDYKEGKGFFLYTGRGPSGPMHIGHLVPFLFTKWLQDKFDVNLYIMISDDEKYLQKGFSWEEIDKYSKDNILDISALGFDRNKTFIFRDSEYVRNVYRLLMRTARKITFSTAKAVFGFDNSVSIGMAFYPAYQIVPTFFEKRRCLIPAAIDQDPYWRIQRDIAESMGYYKAAAVHSKFLPPLQGISGKMSSSQEESAIWLTDPPEVVRKKIMKYAFSGGRPTVDEHRRLGGIPEIDVSFQWLSIFLLESDEEVERIYNEYKSGRMLTGELKSLTVEKLNEFLEWFRSRREEAEDWVNDYMYQGKLAREMWERVYE